MSRSYSSDLRESLCRRMLLGVRVAVLSKECGTIAFQARGSITRMDFGLDHELEKEAGGKKVRGDILIDIDAELVRPL